MNKPTVKRSVIRNMYSALTLDTLKDNKLILVTPYGIITGTPVKSTDNKNLKEMSVVEKSSYLTKVILDTVMKQREETDGEVVVDGNDGCIVLENAEIRVANVTNRFATLVVFYDQVIGVTIGNVDVIES